MSTTMLICLMLLPAGDPQRNHWRSQVPAAVRRAESSGTGEAHKAALDIAWKADDWQAGLELAERAVRLFPELGGLRGYVVRAFWRAGRIEEAERIAAQLGREENRDDVSEATKRCPPDPIALRVGIDIALARGDRERVRELAERLRRRASRDPEDLFALYGTQVAFNELAGATDLLRKLERAVDPNRGYPENYVAEAIEGLADFMKAVGAQPVNQVAAHGAAPMPPLPLLNLPSCDVLINGRGPYRLVVDTGGSIMVALDSDVAEEIGLKSLAESSVRGVSGKTPAGQALIEELQIGNIRCKRVIARTFPVRSTLLNAADGILGTGIFMHDRVTLDFATGQLSLAPSSRQPANGEPVDARIISDAKVVVPVTIEDQPAVALLDTGADAIALSPARLKTLFPDRPIQRLEVSITLGVGSGSIPVVSLGSGVRLKFAGREFPNYGGLGLDVLDEVLGPVLGMQTDILLGMPLFRTMKSLTVDYPHAKLWVEWLSR